MILNYKSFVIPFFGTFKGAFEYNAATARNLSAVAPPIPRKTYTMQIRKLLALGIIACLSLTKVGAQTWNTRSTSGFDYDWQSVIYNGSKFLAVGRSVSGLSNMVMTSTDGLTWSKTNHNLPDVNMNDVIYVNGTYIAACSFIQGSGADQGIRMVTSSDGINWTSRSVPNSDWQSLAYDGSGRIVAVASVPNLPSTTYVITSDNNGTSWTSRTIPSSSNVWRDVTYGNGKFVAVSTYCPNGDPNIIYSSDGITWNNATVPSGNPTYWSITYGNNRFVAVSENGGAANSTDGITWTATTTPANNNWRAVTYGSGKYVAVSSSGTGNRAMVSTDGINWSSENSATNNNWRGLTFGNNLFVAVGNTGTENRVMTRDASIVALPVCGLTFTGFSKGKMVQLNWNTETEMNSSHFEVERSADGRNYSIIGKVNAAGNSVSKNNYNYADRNTLNGLAYYRLKQVDMNGQFTYSKILPVMVIAFSRAAASPNPAETEITIHIPADWSGVYQYRIHDTNGRLLKQSGELQTGSFPVNLGQLPSGSYLLSLWENGELRQQQWLLKQ